MEFRLKRIDIALPPEMKCIARCCERVIAQKSFRFDEISHSVGPIAANVADAQGAQTTRAVLSTCEEELDGCFELFLRSVEYQFSKRTT